ncbi:hypothetical protein TNCV_3789671 [Trichonephila clavipes]|nr:hypothetical protein TNCV_3789671 [Trichonephila clavipes]
MGEWLFPEGSVCSPFRVSSVSLGIPPPPRPTATFRLKTNDGKLWPRRGRWSSHNKTVLLRLPVAIQFEISSFSDSMTGSE